MVDDFESIIKLVIIWELIEYMNMWLVKFVVFDDNIFGYVQFLEGSGFAGLLVFGEEVLIDGVVMCY